MEIKRQDGRDYPPNSLQQLVAGLQRYLRNGCGKSHVNFFKERTNFNALRLSLDTRMKELHAAGIGIGRNSSDPVTLDDELKLWCSGVFNTETAVGISNIVFYYNGKLFGVRGFQEHVNSQASQFVVCEDQQQNVRFVKYTPAQRKNSQGGLKNKKAMQDPIRHYEHKTGNTI